MTAEKTWSGDPGRSARRARLIRWLPPLLTWVIRFLHFTLRLRYLVPPATQALFRSGRPFVLAFWHGRMLIMPYVLQSRFPGGRPAWTLISQHWDGEIIARTVRPFGILSIRGSSTRGGRAAFEEMVSRLRAGGPVVITPDGPRGPRYRVHAGILRLAEQTGVPIVPVSWSARPRWRFSSWDRFQVPLPFARVVAAYGEPFEVRKEAGPDWLEAHRRALEQRLNGLTQLAEARAREERIRGRLFIAYNLLLMLFSLVALPFFAWKVFSVSKHRAGFLQRLGIHRGGRPGGAGESRRPLWVHAVSVGEVLATVPFVRRFGEAFPGVEIVASTITPTGQAVARSKLEGVRRIIYFPFDYALSASLALRSIRPRLFIHTETEIWPNFLFTLGKQGIPSAIINGRISLRSCRQYGWFRFFFRRVLDNVTVFGMQSRADCLRIIRIGADPRRVHITGNMKFDLPLPRDAELRTEASRDEMGFPRTAVVFVAGSTHQGEEEILLAAFGRLRSRFPSLKMLLAPRHPERCDEVERLSARLGVRMERRTLRKGRESREVAEVLLLDTIGELAQAYSLGDVVFVGGSLVPVGGHNLLEPVIYQKPVLFGPYTDNTADIANALIQAGGGILVRDVGTLLEEVGRLLDGPGYRESVGRAAFGILEEHRGATERNLAILRPFFEA